MQSFVVYHPEHSPSAAPYTETQSFYGVAPSKMLDGPVILLSPKLWRSPQRTVSIRGTLLFLRSASVADGLSDPHSEDACIPTVLPGAAPYRVPIIFNGVPSASKSQNWGKRAYQPYDLPLASTMRPRDLMHKWQGWPSTDGSANSCHQTSSISSFP